jgi:Family of unknown function (DUF6763)
MSSMKACEGQWYLDRAHHEFFLVIAIDESDGVIDVRDRYGDIDEFDLDEWEAMGLVLCTAPGGMPRELNAEWDAEEWDAEDEDSEERPAN